MEKYSVSFSPEARSETMKAYLWYQREQSDLEKNFREDLSIKIESIKQIRSLLHLYIKR
jgi:hypothetical protein